MFQHIDRYNPKVDYMASRSRHPWLPRHSCIPAHQHATSKKEQRHLKEHALRGNDIVDSVMRLCAMNLYLHGIGGEECPVTANDALAKEVGDDRVDMVLANPPFGKKSSNTVINEKIGKKEQEKLVYEREDFWATTSNKQLTNLSETNLNSRILAGPEVVSLRDETSSFVQHIAKERLSPKRCNH